MELWQVDIVGGVRLVDAARRRSCRGSTTTAASPCAPGWWPRRQPARCATRWRRRWRPMGCKSSSTCGGPLQHERPHQAIGRVPPIERFRLAAPRPGPAETSEPAALDIGRPAPTRRVSAKGTITSRCGARQGRGVAGRPGGGGGLRRRSRAAASPGVCSSPPPRRRPTLWPPVRCSRRRSAASCLCRRVRRDDPYAIGELVALAWARIRTYPARPNRGVAANLLMDVRKQFAQDRLVGGGGVDTVGLPLERADDVPPLEREAIAPPLPTGYRSGAG